MIFFIFLVESKVHIWEPKSLKNLYSNREFSYTIMNFGIVPYGHSIYGTVFKATPYDACSELRPLTWDQNYGTLILMVHRNGCNFSEKVLNAQKIGAGFVIISDNRQEDVHRIFPVERSKEILDEVKIPSVLISQQDSENILKAIEATGDKMSIRNSQSVEMAIYFELTKTYKKSSLKFIISVDDYRSYDLLLSFYPIYHIFKRNMLLKIHFKLFKRNVYAGVEFKEEDCIGNNKMSFCVTKSLGNTHKVGLIGRETLKQLCLKDYSLKEFVNYLTRVRNKCFEGNQVVENFTDCTDKISKK